VRYFEIDVPQHGANAVVLRDTREGDHGESSAQAGQLEVRRFIILFDLRGQFLMPAPDIDSGLPSKRFQRDREPAAR
jgi:hypothetical protein